LLWAILEMGFEIHFTLQKCFFTHPPTTFDNFTSKLLQSYKFLNKLYTNLFRIWLVLIMQQNQKNRNSLINHNCIFTTIIIRTMITIRTTTTKNHINYFKHFISIITYTHPFNRNPWSNLWNWFKPVLLIALSYSSILKRSSLKLSNKFFSKYLNIFLKNFTVWKFYDFTFWCFEILHVDVLRFYILMFPQ
jgi:hypothetical protein